MAKLFVSLGAPLQFKDGEILPPLQPNTFATCSSFMVEPSLISPLVTVMFCANAEVLNTPNTANNTPDNILCIVPSLASGARTLARPFRNVLGHGDLGACSREQQRPPHRLIRSAWNFAPAGQSAIDGEDRASGIGGQRRSQKCDRRGDF